MLRNVTLWSGLDSCNLVVVHWWVLVNTARWTLGFHKGPPPSLSSQERFYCIQVRIGFSAYQMRQYVCGHRSVYIYVTITRKSHRQIRILGLTKRIYVLNFELGFMICDQAVINVTKTLWTYSGVEILTETSGNLLWVHTILGLVAPLRGLRAHF